MQDHSTIEPAGGEQGGRFCTYEGCERKRNAKGYCALHYSRTRNGVPLGAPLQRAPKHTYNPCSVDGCDRPRAALGLCRGHRTRLKRGERIDVPLHGEMRYCGVEGCDRQHSAGGLCKYHDQRRSRGLPLIRDNVGVKGSHREGYVRICLGDNQWVLEHRHVMAQHIGRELYRHEEVHHLNGQRD